MKYIDAEKLFAELTKMQFTLNAAYRNPQSDNIVRAISLEYDDILSLIESLQQEQPNRPDFDDVDPKHPVHSHYTKVRETKTGRVFWAEYSSEAAEWYEAGTGKAYSISDVEILKEQQEVDLEKVVMIDNVIMNMTAEGYNNGYKTRPFYEEVLRRFNARKE